MADFIEDKKKHYPSSQQQEIQQQVNDYTDRAAAQEAVNSQAAVGATTPNAEVADFAAGKAGGNTPVSTQPAGETPVTDDYANRVAAQRKIDRQQPVVNTTPNAEVADFAAGKAGVNGGTTPVSGNGVPAGKPQDTNTQVAEGGEDTYRQSVINGATGQPTGQKYVQYGETEPDKMPGQLAADKGSAPVEGMANLPGVETVPAGKPQAADTQQGTGTQQTTQETGTQQQVTTPSNHLTDWSNTTLEKYMAGDGKNTPQRQILDDYLRWCNENGVMPDYYTINDIMNNSTDMKLSPVDEEKARKKAANKEKWDKVGNFLLHLGNAIGNVAGGGYASMKLEDPVQWSERQRLIKEKNEQQRRLNNQSIWKQMQTEWTNQRAYELKKQQAEATALYRQSLAEAAKQKAENDKQKVGAYVAYYNAKTGAIEMKTPEEIAKIKADTKKAEQQGDAAMIRANKAGSSSKGKQSSGYVDTYERDRKGRTLKHERTPKGSVPAAPAGNTGKKPLPKANK